MKSRLRGLLATLATPPEMRGRVSKVSVLPDGTRSVVIRFGIDEPGARDLVPGTLFGGRVLEQKPKEKAGG